MFELPTNPVAIEYDMRAQNRQVEEGDSYRWFEPTVQIRPDWLTITVKYVGHRLVLLGQAMENYAHKSAPATERVEFVLMER